MPPALEGRFLTPRQPEKSQGFGFVFLCACCNFQVEFSATSLGCMNRKEDLQNSSLCLSLGPEMVLLLFGVFLCLFCPTSLVVFSRRDRGKYTYFIIFPEVEILTDSCFEGNVEFINFSFFLPSVFLLFSIISYCLKRRNSTSLGL